MCCGNNGWGGDGCLWIILILIILFCCCGNSGSCGGGCHQGCGCNDNCC